MNNTSNFNNLMAQVRRELYVTEFKLINDAVQKLQQDLADLKLEQLRLFDRVLSLEAVVEKENGDKAATAINQS